MVNKAIEPRLAITFPRGMLFGVLIDEVLIFFNEAKAEFCSKSNLSIGKTFLSTHEHLLEVS